MAFTMPQYPILKPEQVSPLHMALKTAMSNYRQNMQTAYMPRMMEADIFGKEAAPIATIASNPFIWATMPEEQRQSMTQALGKMMQNINGGMGSMENTSPSPQGMMGNMGGAPNGGGQPSSGGMGNYPNLQSGNYDYPAVRNGSQQPMNGDQNGAPNSYNPVIPAAGEGTAQGAVSKITAPYQQSPYPPGTIFYDPKTNKTYSSPTASSIGMSQTSYNAIERAVPQLNKIASESEEFLKQGGKLGIITSGVGGWLSNLGAVSPDTLKKMNIDPEKYSRYQKFRADIALALDSLMSAFPNIPQSNLSMATMAHALEPVQGETSKGYSARILQTAATLQNEQMPALQRQMGQAIPLDGGREASGLAQQLEGSQPAQQEGIAQYSAMPGSEGVVQQVKQVGKERLIKINGQWFHAPT